VAAVLLGSDLSFYNIFLLLGGIKICKRVQKYWDQPKKPAAVEIYLLSSSVSSPMKANWSAGTCSWLYL